MRKNPTQFKKGQSTYKKATQQSKTEGKSRRKNQHPNPSNAGNLAPHVIQAANRLAAPAPLFSEYALANIKNGNNLVRLRIENIRISNSFNEKRASIERSIIRSKLPMHKKTSSKPKKNKGRGRIHTQRAPFQRQISRGKGN